MSDSQSPIEVVTDYHVDRFIGLEELKIKLGRNVLHSKEFRRGVSSLLENTLCIYWGLVSDAKAERHPSSSSGELAQAERFSSQLSDLIDRSDSIRQHANLQNSNTELKKLRTALSGAIPLLRENPTGSFSLNRKDWAARAAVAELLEFWSWATLDGAKPSLHRGGKGVAPAATFASAALAIIGIEVSEEKIARYSEDDLPRHS